MEYYLYSVDLPFSRKTISYREINSREQLVLSKIDTMYDFNNTENVFEYCKNFRKIILNCVENKEDFLKLNIIDYILFLIKLRIISFGNDIVLEFEKKDQEMKQKVSLDLNVLMKNIFDLANKSFQDKELKFENISIALDWPKMESELVFINKEEIDIEKQIMSTITEYIKIIKIKEKIIDFGILTIEEKNLFLTIYPLK
jgi:hypothetical protein